MLHEFISCLQICHYDRQVKKIESSEYWLERPEINGKTEEHIDDCLVIDEYNLELILRFFFRLSNHFNWLSPSDYWTKRSWLTW